jgi:hypothetical protein
VIVGCLPAFKSLIASRAALNRSNNGYSGSRSKTNANLNPSNSRLRKTSIPLDSFSKEKKTGWQQPTGSDSQEEMVKPDDARAHTITVKNDVVSDYKSLTLLLLSLTPFRDIDCLI